ncbi:hypothetical protein Q0Z83_027990 [Actinoplanes sichuanensis]|uniref:DUF4303 domain-containing protein n=1 Tax=Actinoplanes sichuanensis TaxID=512349 RepID=A0ABW4AU10_9ACTN|nr:DUF4303 domain-containing protein [Actinoplanes sichuanensis]BEL04608.1 hypothetical protein Q0Z83_027990 [Actinoplanes sichuanensis]
MNWDAFETAWHDSGCRALASLADSHPDENLYAAAFHLFYSDGTTILSPAFAANADSAVHDRDGYSTRFVAPEWRWDVLAAASDAMWPWYQRMSEESPDDTAHDAAMARVCKAMTATARQGRIHDSLPAGFVVVILDGQRGDEEADLIRASVDHRVLASVPGLAEHLREIAPAR